MKIIEMVKRYRENHDPTVNERNMQHTKVRWSHLSNFSFSRSEQSQRKVQTKTYCMLCVFLIFRFQF